MGVDQGDPAPSRGWRADASVRLRPKFRRLVGGRQEILTRARLDIDHHATGVFLSELAKINRHRGLMVDGTVSYRTDWRRELQIRKGGHDLLRVGRVGLLERF